MTDQSTLDFKHHLARVGIQIGPEITRFCQDRIYAKRPEFHMDDLRKHLESRKIPFAPASPDRILRRLRILKIVDYKVVNRGQSLYQITKTALTGVTK